MILISHIEPGTPGHLSREIPVIPNQCRKCEAVDPTGSWRVCSYRTAGWLCKSCFDHMESRVIGSPPPTDWGRHGRELREAGLV